MAGQQERFGERLRLYREAAGYSQEELAHRAGLSANAISALERGERKRPYPDTLRRLAEALGLSDEVRSELAAALPGRGSGALGPVPGAGRLLPTMAELPGELTPLIGRAHEVEVVRQLLLRLGGRLLTLTGPGGVGKTRLARHVARSVTDLYVDGVVWIELAPLGDPTLVLPTIARALGVEESLGGDPRATLRSWLRERRVLLVIDNVEHLLDAVPDLAKLLHACPDLHILTTSRSPLRIRGEQEYVVPPLELPSAGRGGVTAGVAAVPSVQLFVWRAQQQNPSFELNEENATTVAEICRRLDGLPLALELVAARVRVLSLTELLSRLNRLMPLLVGGARDLPARQQTMRAAINWSYELLNSAEQALFRRLSVFAGGWTLEAAEAVGTEGAVRADEVFDRLGALVEQSLVTVTHEVHGTRYGILEPVRQFALERLEASGEAEKTWWRHARYYLALAEQAALEFEGHAGQVAWLERLEREHDNLRAAMNWSEAGPDGAEIGLRLASALWRFWEVRGHVEEGRRWLASALAKSDGLPPEVQAKAFSAAGNLARDQADHEAATVYHEQSLALRRELGDTRGIAISLNNLGVVARDRGDAERTLRLCQESLALFRALGDQHRAAIALISLGMAAGQLGEYEQARSYYEESLTLFRGSGDDWHTGWVLNYLADLMVRKGDLDTARSLVEESLALLRETSDAWGIQLALGILGRIAQAENDLDLAVAQFAEGLRQVVRAQLGRAIPACLEDLAGVLVAWGQPERAARLGGASEALRGMTGATPPPAGAVDLSGLRTGPHAAAWVEGRALTREQVIAEATTLAEEFAQLAAGR